GQGPPLHTHPYVEVAFTLEGCAAITVGDETREVKAGGIVVIPANTPHRFVNSGDTILRQIDIHASPRFIQTNLTCRSLGKMCTTVPCDRAQAPCARTFGLIARQPVSRQRMTASARRGELC